MSKFKELYKLGQSPWYDNIDRRFIRNGTLRSLFDMGIVGVTSNPTIFEKAVVSSDIYDEKIRRLQKEGKGLEAIYDELTCDDVRDAADMLVDVHLRTKGVDGYVSIEVLPACAHDPEKTIEYARALFKKVNRSNIMIKVPGTKEAPSAIRALIAEGIPVNATLLFSQKHYESAACAYLDGLQDRLNKGLPVARVASVASVFVSRIDTKIDHLLDIFSNREVNLEEKRRIDFLKGKIAIANTKFIYQKFKDIFREEKFFDFKAADALPQRALWASTSTKNPAYDDCVYVDNLIGPLTVNTMPHQTVLAFADHGRPQLTLENDMTGAAAYLIELEKLNINLETICQEAQNEGLQAFEKSFETLMDSIKGKMR